MAERAESMRHLLIEDSASLAAAGSDGDAVLWTQSSGLAHAEAVRGRDVRALDRCAESAALPSLWADLSAERPAFAAALAVAETDPAYAHVAHSCARTVYSLALQLATKAVLLDRWLVATADAPSAVVGSPRLTPVAQIRASAGEYDHLFAALAARYPRDRAPRLVEVPPIPRERFMAAFSYVPPLDKLFNSANRPASSLRFKLWKRRARPIGDGRRGTLQILRENELIEESFTHLVRDGWRVVDTPIAGLPAGEGPAGRAEAALEALCAVFRRVVDRHAGGAAEAAAGLFRTRMEDLLHGYPAALAGVRARVDGWRRQFGEAGGRWATLSTGLYAPTHRLHDACLREAGASVVCTDHGSGVGLLARLDALADDYIGFSDQYLTFNTEIADMFRRAAAGEGLDLRMVGSPTEMSRARFPRLQRALTRRAAGLSGGEPVLMYVTSIGQNNLVQGAGMGSDLQYAEFQRRLIDCLPAFPGRAAIKPYPAHRFADPEQVWTMPLPDGVERMAFGEFRHSRWAADLLLLDVHSSTISWALGSGRPIVYVDNPADPLTDRAREALAAGLFYIDGRMPDWPERLRALLARGLPALRRDWQAMATARKRFSERFALGPDGAPGPRVAEALRALAEGPPPIRRFRPPEPAVPSGRETPREETRSAAKVLP